MRKNKIVHILYVIVLVIFIIFGTMLVIRLAELRRGNMFYQQAAETESLVFAASDNSISSVTSDIWLPVFENQECGPVLPKIHEGSLHLSRFAEKYPETAIWLKLPDTPLSYPVMLGKDNQFYLNHLPDGSKNALGSLFLDYRTKEDSGNFIIYGHNGSGGKMFGLLKQYESQDYFLQHKTITIATMDSVYVCPIFSVRRVEAGSDAYRLEFEDEESLISYINQAALESIYPIDIELEDATKVITLSTCTGWPNQRLIVQAVIL